MLKLGEDDIIKMLQLKIKKLKLQIQILQIKLAILILKQKRTIPDLPQPVRIILHHGGGWLDFKGVNAWHKIRWGFKSSLGHHAGYHYFIEYSTGEVFQARADNEEGAHTTSSDYPPHYLNSTSIGICLMGNGCEKPFSDKQLISLKKLVNRKRIQYGIPLAKVFGHRDFSATLCPSNRLYKWLKNYKKVEA